MQKIESSLKGLSALAHWHASRKATLHDNQATWLRKRTAPPATYTCNVREKGWAGPVALVQTCKRPFTRTDSDFELARDQVMQPHTVTQSLAKQHGLFGSKNSRADHHGGTHLD